MAEDACLGRAETTLTPSYYVLFRGRAGEEKDKEDKGGRRRKKKNDKRKKDTWFLIPSSRVDVRSSLRRWLAGLRKPVAAAAPPEDSGNVRASTR